MLDNRCIDVCRAQLRAARVLALFALLLCAAAPAAAQCCRVSFPGDELVTGASANVLLRGPWMSSAWRRPLPRRAILDRKSTRLNSSHQIISYAVPCLYSKRYSQ